MKNTDAASTFNQKLAELTELAHPTHIGQNLKEIILYEKLLEIEENINRLEKKLEDK